MSQTLQLTYEGKAILFPAGCYSIVAVNDGEGITPDYFAQLAMSRFGYPDFEAKKLAEAFSEAGVGEAVLVQRTTAEIAETTIGELQKGTNGQLQVHAIRDFNP